MVFKTDYSIMKVKSIAECSSVDPEGGRGSGPPSPGKSQVIWVSIGNKQLVPPHWK